MATGNTAITQGDATGGRVATHTFTEDAVTKSVQRVAINTSAGVDLVGRQAAAASLAMVLSTEDKASLDAAGASRGYDVAITFTRPANVTAYTANDVVGATAAALTIAAIGPASGSITITGAQLELDIAAIPTGMGSFKLALYSVTPPSALADNAAFDLPSGDRASFLGLIDVGSPVDLGSTLYVETSQSKPIKLAASANLFAYLITNGAFTPGAVSEVYAITLHTVAN